MFCLCVSSPDFRGDQCWSYQVFCAASPPIPWMLEQRQQITLQRSFQHLSLLLRASVGMRVSLPEERIKIVPHRLYFQEQQAHRGGSKAAEPRGSAGAGRCWARQGSLPSLPALSTQKLLKRSLMMSIPAARPFMSNDTSITWTEVPDSYLL